MITLIFTLLACSTPVTPASTPAELAAVADAIVATPSDADAILTSHGLDRAGFEAKLYEIATDPAKSKEYLAARKR